MLKENFPVLFSRRFWGIFLFALLGYLQAKSWISGPEVEFLTQVVMLATGVGVADSFARKVGKKK